jgi:hypothetical protein
MRDTARETAEILLHALAVGDGSTVAALLEPTFLQLWRDAFVAGLLFWAWQAAQGDDLSPAGGIATERSLDDLIDVLLPRFGNSPVAYIGAATTVADAASQSPELLLVAAIARESAALAAECEQRPSARFEILRIQREREDFAHVHYSRRAFRHTGVKASVLTLARAESKWLFRSGQLHLPRPMDFVLFAAVKDD